VPPVALNERAHILALLCDTSLNEAERGTEKTFGKSNKPVNAWNSRIAANATVSRRGQDDGANPHGRRWRKPRCRLRGLKRSLAKCSWQKGTHGCTSEELAQFVGRGTPPQKKVKPELRNLPFGKPSGGGLANGNELCNRKKALLWRVRKTDPLGDRPQSGKRLFYSRPRPPSGEKLGDLPQQTTV